MNATVAEDDRRAAIRAEGRFYAILLTLLLVGFAWRALYVWWQAALDPWYAHPQLDGAYYLDWARALARGDDGPAGAFYLAPLYPYALALFLRLFGEDLTWLYLLQQALSVGTAGLLAYGARGVVGTSAALWAAVLFLLHHPLLFFASRPLGETLALALLVAALVSAWRLRSRPRLAPLCGLLAGAAALARPNLLLVPLGWAAGSAVRRRWAAAGLLLVGLAVALLPATVRNWVASGHAVWISSNAGITAYHGNAPGARGVFTHPPGFDWGLERQREQARAIASARSGRSLDAVQADAWWGRQALRARLEAPAETAGLLLRRVLLTLDNHEFGLDYPPLLDPNRWRLTVRLGGERELALVPWALLLGLAGAGLALRGVARSGGAEAWSALLACLAMPVLFYVSSRYRLPAAGLLTLPAGAGAAALLEAAGRRSWRRLVGGLAVAAVLAGLSAAVPSAPLRRESTAEGLCNRALAYEAAGRAVQAERDARRAVELDPRSPRLQYNLGVLLAARRQWDEAERAYREALALQPELGAAAVNLGALLFRQERYAEAAATLRGALVWQPANRDAWTNLVAALAAAGDTAAARRAVREAREHGVEIEGGLIRLLEERLRGETRKEVRDGGQN